MRFKKQTTLRVAVEHWEPHVIVQEHEGIVTISGPMAHLLTVLSRAINFKYTLVRPPDGAWGAPDSNGVWNGMIGMVKRNEADLALGPFGLTGSRAAVAEFSQPIIIDYYRILVKRGSAKPDPWSFLNPLRPTVWLGFLLSFLLVCVGLAVGVFLGWERKRWSSSRKLSLTFVYSWEQFANMCQQRTLRNPSDISLRMVVCVWLLALLVILRSYSGALTSLLAVRQIPVKIDTLRDLIDAKEYGLIFETSTAMSVYMKEAKSGIFAELEKVNKKGRSQFLISSLLFNAAFTLVRSKNYALLVEETTIKKIISDDFSSKGRCDFYMAKETYFPLIFCIIAHKGLPIMPAVNFWIQALVENNLYNEWIGRELQNATTCLKAPTTITVNEPYNMKGLWGVFTMLFTGLCASTIMFLYERVAHCCPTHQHSHW
nr:probable glutamate receptor [Procambarus clarkii]